MPTPTTFTGGPGYPSGMTAKNILISGASGLIGTELTAQLRAEGHTVVSLVRRPATNHNESEWDPEAGQISDDAIAHADAVINLSGASLSRLPWTLAYKRTILQSRVRSTKVLAQAIARSATPPAVFVSGSAVGFYGDRPSEALDEASPRGKGFLSKVVESWENATAEASNVSRVVNARTGLVIARGGALTPLMLLARFGLAGPLGSGTQHWPWVSLHDEAAALRHLALKSQLEGPVNIVGPTPATADFIGRTLASRMHRPYWLPAPRWALRAVLADAGRDLLLADQAVASKLSSDGFEFRDKSVANAIDAALATR